MQRYKYGGAKVCEFDRVESYTMIEEVLEMGYAGTGTNPAAGANRSSTVTRRVARNLVSNMSLYPTLSVIYPKPDSLRADADFSYFRRWPGFECRVGSEYGINCIEVSLVAMPV
jgi:hypothetical protein